MFGSNVHRRRLNLPMCFLYNTNKNRDKLVDKSVDNELLKYKLGKIGSTLLGESKEVLMKDYLSVVAEENFFSRIGKQLKLLVSGKGWISEDSLNKVELSKINKIYFDTQNSSSPLVKIVNEKAKKNLDDPAACCDTSSTSLDPNLYRKHLKDVSLFL